MAKKAPGLADIAMADRLEEKDYEARLKAAQLRLLAIQQAYWRKKRRGIVVLEGWDASGKGGTIQRLSERLDPRRLHVIRIGAPTPAEQGRHYLWRFWQSLPAPGEIAVFDRSWYGRVLVERIDGFAERKAWKRAYREINEFERMLADDGVILAKVFLHVSQEEQRQRLIDRLEKPHKQWKITLDDFHNFTRRAAYVEAIDDMLTETDTRRAPWRVVASDHKWTQRVQTLEWIADRLADDIDLTIPRLDRAIAQAARKVLDWRGGE